MMDYIEHLKVPASMAFYILLAFFIMNIIGTILDFKGKVVPEFMNIRKYFKRKKQERELLKEVPELLNNVKGLLTEVNKHYNDDNITKRDDWMKWVNGKAKIYDTSLVDLDKKLDNINDTIISLVINIKRTNIINFASKVSDDKFPVTREQFNRIFKEHEEYEAIIEENNRTNGEVEIAYTIIVEAYKKHIENKTFIEDIRGYNTSKEV